MFGEARAWHMVKTFKLVRLAKVRRHGRRGARKRVLTPRNRQERCEVLQ